MYRSSSCLTSRRLYSRRHAFTLLELLIVIVIIAQLAAILFPVFSRVRESARRSTCQGNLKQIGLALLQYSQDYDDLAAPISIPAEIYPGMPITPWDVLIQPYTKNSQIFQCPSDVISRRTSDMNTVPNYSQGAIRSYALTHYTNGVSLAAIPQPSLTFNIMERTNIHYGRSTWYYSANIENGGSIAALNDDLIGGGPKKEWRHLNTSNFLYMDGHVKALPKSSSNSQNIVLPNHTKLDASGNSIFSTSNDLPQ